MRRQSLRAAQRCETAKTKVCRCRCGGLLHGKDREGAEDPDFYRMLPRDDPHHALAKRVAKKRVLAWDRS